jgi:catechol 2,3-dioxygenase-like lactoylglutathione lyase family enzyme
MDQQWKFIHVGMVVRDLQKTVERLRALGVASAPDMEPVALPGKAPDRTEGTGTILRLDITCGGLCIEVLQPVSGDNIQQRWLAAHGEGISHVCYDVPDIAQARVQMAAQGVPVLCHIHETTTYYDTGEPGSLQIELRQTTGVA